MATFTRKGFTYRTTSSQIATCDQHCFNCQCLIRKGFVCFSTEKQNGAKWLKRPDAVCAGCTSGADTAPDTF